MAWDDLHEDALTLIGRLCIRCIGRLFLQNVVCYGNSISLEKGGVVGALNLALYHFRSNHS